ncbi:MAG: undecaprenyldiphospho-muramoylpentapeptide beta-N-acetylglucosaminyltransferase [Legionella sp. 21-45-4]|nr:MAG: undecaprenyldiphospho-muramoylpentapeptide beta-N-acetylglucosaminyltransferase [Legionella sp. 21-45-4]
MEGIEREMIQRIGVAYYSIRTGKLRRYFSWQNFLDPFNVMYGIVQAFGLVRRLKPHVVFSKGGFVALPVAIAAWLNRIPVIAHESDSTPGLANRLCLPFVTQLCVTFPQTHVSKTHQHKVKITGTPIRSALLTGSDAHGRELCGFHADLPCLLVVGGSQGSHPLNQCVRDALSDLCQHYQVIHVCGKGNLDAALNNHPGYCQFEYVDKTFSDLLAASRLVVSRAGANTLMELLALAKPHVLVPLSRKRSRGDQIENAAYFARLGASVVIDEDALTPAKLLSVLDSVERDYDTIVQQIHALGVQSATQTVIDIILKTASHTQAGDT